MANRVKITAGETVVHATLNDTDTARKIFEGLPLEARGQTPQATVEAGDLAYWEPGSAFCIFFGPTPMSVGKEIVPADPVTVFGKVDGDATALRAFRGGGKVKVEKAE